MSQTGRVDGPRGEDGFTLLEIVCVIAMLAILAAIVLPAIPRGTSTTKLQSYATETAALLKADRNAAVRRRTDVTATVDPASRTVRSGSSGRSILIPADVTFDAKLATRCNDRPAGPTIRFFASGMSCGGAIKLARPGVGFEIRVSWLTGEVE
ncbi:MAG TPA: prepilin-type N-terminal cleavage/methylation domain-containing protein, partial [Bradyrhizobium sp.]|nr:prepilin-type N-terminal cleavage/methylation domain-containing protein [Bradyrhizobium sp.]